jgi:hypothetical protein
MLGGDSMALDLETYGALPLGGEEKVFRNGGYLFGVTGSFRSVGVLTDAELPPWPQVYQFSWVRKHFLPAIRRAFKRARCVPEKGDACLVAYGGTLFRINLYRRQAFDPRDGYDAIGSGGREALGSFHTSTALASTVPTINPARQVWAALEAAAHHNRGVRPGYYIMDTAYLWRQGAWPLGSGEDFIRAWQDGVGARSRPRR